MRYAPGHFTASATPQDFLDAMVSSSPVPGRRGRAVITLTDDIYDEGPGENDIIFR